MLSNEISAEKESIYDKLVIVDMNNRADTFDNK
jgi:hypothetical protein